VSVFQPIPIVTQNGARAPIAAKMAVFEKHRKILLIKLRKECKTGPNSRPFDEGKSWRDLSQLAKLYFWSEVGNRVTLSGAERSKRLRQLATALRKARSLTDRAMKDELGDLLFIASCIEKRVGPPSAVPMETDGSSALTRLIDEIKKLAAGLTKLETIARAAATNDKPNKVGRSALLSRDCIQGLARVYRTSTGAKPGRGAGPFTDFVSGFALAVGKTDFTHRSLIDAIQDAHLQFTPSWFDGKPPQF
jgi:hypothetical protein